MIDENSWVVRKLKLLSNLVVIISFGVIADTLISATSRELPEDVVIQDIGVSSNISEINLRETDFDLVIGRSISEIQDSVLVTITDSEFITAEPINDVVAETSVDIILDTGDISNQNDTYVTQPEEIMYTEPVNVVFYGDSWMDNNFFRSEFSDGNTIRAKGSMWAKYFVDNSLVTGVQDAKVVFVQFGLNDWQTGEIGLTSNSYMCKFLDQLSVAHPNIPILITRSPHTGSGYVNQTGVNINPRCDRYSQYIAEYCSQHDNFYYVDATSCLEDSDGWLAQGYVDSSTFHLTQEGYDVWFNEIEYLVLSALNGTLKK